MWCACPTRTPQPGKRHPLSRWCNAHRRAGGIVRVHRVPGRCAGGRPPAPRPWRPSGASRARCARRARRCRRGPPRAAALRSRAWRRGELTDFGVRELAALERLGQKWQRAEGVGHADVLAGGAWGEPHAPREPGGARAKAIAPPAAPVKFADEIEQSGGGGVEVSGQLGDLVAELIEIAVGRSTQHWRVPLLLRRLYTRGFEAPP